MSLQLTFRWYDQRLVNTIERLTTEPFFATVPRPTLAHRSGKRAPHKRGISPLRLGGETLLLHLSSRLFHGESDLTLAVDLKALNPNLISLAQHIPDIINSGV